MKSVGIIRELDHLGRIVIPKETRVLLGIHMGDPLEIFINSEEKMLALRKHVGVACKMCGAVDQLTYFRNSFLCSNCVHDLKEGKNCLQYAEEESAQTEPKERRTTRNSDELLGELKVLMAKHPTYTQKDYARLLNTSQPRISQLKRLMQEQ
ncbi:transcriptional pleiotropic regulator of transition state genes [Paenibacillus sp. 1182]|uniref:transition state regulator Abh n=1 Tax=Paenibacillus sp. 1182 TaxID=2806565 RepID=UPI001AE90753|nr:transition state regulator Abh [Paenibacillus sp. 1182]MBP1309063.1 transcriptional pleiotropic regulator of transition state genes [Paenibacillus sp. 1182]